MEDTMTVNKQFTNLFLVLEENCGIPAKTLLEEALLSYLECTGLTLLEKHCGIPMGTLAIEN